MLEPLGIGLSVGVGQGVGLVETVATNTQSVIDAVQQRDPAERENRIRRLPRRWRSLAEELGVGGASSRALEGRAMFLDAPGNLVRAHDRPIFLLGVEGLAVIDAGDALLVADLGKSGAVRDVVARLRKHGWGDLL